MARYVSINSFVETVIRTQQRGEVARWPLTAGRRPAILTWLQRLAELPGRFDFHVALRRFDVSHPERPRLGEAERPSEERIRHRANALGELHRRRADRLRRRGDDGALARLTVGFLGLWGANGPAAESPDRVRPRPASIRPAIRRSSASSTSSITGCSCSSIGRGRPPSRRYRWTAPSRTRSRATSGPSWGSGLEATRNRGGATDFAKLHYAPLFATSARNADGLSRRPLGLLRDAGDHRGVRRRVARPARRRAMAPRRAARDGRARPGGPGRARLVARQQVPRPSSARSAERRLRADAPRRRRPSPSAARSSASTRTTSGTGSFASSSRRR